MMRRPIARGVAVLFMFGFYTLLFAPLIVVVGASFDGTKGGFLNFPPRHPSLLAYRAIPSDYINALGVSCALGVAAALISTGIGVAAALGLVRGKLPGKPFIAALLRAPLQIPTVVVGLGFLQFYYQAGAATGLFVQQTFVGLLAGHVFITLPFVIAPVAAVLQRFSANLEEAAISLGATRWRTFRPGDPPGHHAGSLGRRALCLHRVVRRCSGVDFPRRRTYNAVPRGNVQRHAIRLQSWHPGDIHAGAGGVVPGCVGRPAGAGPGYIERRQPMTNHNAHRG